MVCLVLVMVFLVSIIPACTPKVNGAMPRYAAGDNWVYRWVTGGQTYTVTTTVTGQDSVDGEDCLVFETTFDPAYQSVVSITNKYKKSNLDLVFIDYKTDKPDGSFTSIVVEAHTDKPFYPLEVNKVVTETDYQEITFGNESIATSENSTLIFATRVEKIESVRVAAGTFSCFKVLKYDDTGNITSISWRSDKVKLLQVKTLDMSAPEDTYELISYSLK